MRKLALSVAVAATVLAPSAAQAGPGPTEEPIYCGPGMTQVGATCQTSVPPEQTEQEAAWETLVFGGLLVVYAVGTAIVGV